MPGIHRNTDTRYCLATTIVTGQSTVFINSKLAAVENDECTHFEGKLKSIIGSTVFVNGKKIIVFGDTCHNADLAGHAPTLDDPLGKSGDVLAYT